MYDAEWDFGSLTCTGNNIATEVDAGSQMDLGTGDPKVFLELIVTTAFTFTTSGSVHITVHGDNTTMANYAAVVAEDELGGIQFDITVDGTPAVGTVFTIPLAGGRGKYQFYNVACTETGTVDTGAFDCRLKFGGTTIITPELPNRSFA